MTSNSWSAFSDQDEAWFQTVFTHWRPLLPYPSTVPAASQTKEKKPDVNRLKEYNKLLREMLNSEIVETVSRVLSNEVLEVALKRMEGQTPTDFKKES